MKRTTHRLAGSRLKRFLRSYFATVEGLDADAAATSANACGEILSSARVLKTASARQIANRRRAGSQDVVQPAVQTGAGTAAPDDVLDSAETRASEPATDFDPFAFGLVPLFQTEGAEAVRAKLETVTAVEHLRAMARAQKIGLPADIRRGEVDASAVRDAIVIGVEKRIADRRAAAS